MNLHCTVTDWIKYDTTIFADVTNDKTIVRSDKLVNKMHTVPLFLEWTCPTTTPDSTGAPHVMTDKDRMDLGHMSGDWCDHVPGDNRVRRSLYDIVNDLTLLFNTCAYVLWWTFRYWVVKSVTLTFAILLTLSHLQRTPPISWSVTQRQADRILRHALILRVSVFVLRFNFFLVTMC